MTQKQPGQPNKLWLAIAQDSFEMPIVLVFGLYGLFSFIFSDFATPPSVASAATTALVMVWHVTMAGGIAAAIGRTFEWERLELSGLASLGFSCGFYLVVAVGFIGSASLGLAALLFAVLSGCIARGYIIRKSLKAQDLAHNIADIVRHSNGNGGDQ
jgi:hypothetical protein